jgi:hypothetical protein
MAGPAGIGPTAPAGKPSAYARPSERARQREIVAGERKEQEAAALLARQQRREQRPARAAARREARRQEHEAEIARRGRQDEADRQASRAKYHSEQGGMKGVREGELERQARKPGAEGALPGEQGTD